MNQNAPAPKHKLRQYMRAWFSLTTAERLTAAIVLGLFLLGLITRYLILRHERSATITAPVAESVESLDDAVTTAP